MDAQVKPTAQQAALIDKLVNGQNNLCLMARAGTGKTSTILMGATAYCQANPGHSVIICAFNKSIADEISEKLEKLGFDWKQLRAATIHSLGFNLVRFVFKSKVDDKKVKNLIDQQNGELYREWSAQIAQLVHLAKMAGVGFFQDAAIADVSVWHQLADHYDVNGLDDTSMMEDIVAAAQHIYKLSLAQTDVVDFDDMVLFPLVKNLRVKFTADVVVNDEAQDTSRAKAALARKFVRPVTGKMMIVGDDCQAIYGFAGADADALGNLTKALAAEILPLTVTWRCPKAVVREAQKLVPDIEASENAKEGQVIRLQELPVKDMEPNRDAILCRNTAPLIQIAYQMIRMGKAVKVEGRAIGEGLLSLARRWKVSTIAALMTKAEAYRDREVQKALARGQEEKADAVTDKVETLLQICHMVLAAGRHDVAGVVEHIQNLFADGAKDAIICATYHRSKGREWERVFLFEHAKRCPSPYAKQDWQKVQERNLAYVAITRAKDILAYVG